MILPLGLQPIPAWVEISILMLNCLRCYHMTPNSWILFTNKNVDFAISRRYILLTRSTLFPRNKNRGKSDTGKTYRANNLLILHHYLGDSTLNLFDCSTELEDSVDEHSTKSSVLEAWLNGEMDEGRHSKVVGAGGGVYYSLRTNGEINEERTPRRAAQNNT